MTTYHSALRARSFSPPSSLLLLLLLLCAAEASSSSCVLDALLPLSKYAELPANYLTPADVEKETKDKQVPPMTPLLSATVRSTCSSNARWVSSFLLQQSPQKADDIIEWTAEDLDQLFQDVGKVYLFSLMLDGRCLIKRACGHPDNNLIEEHHFLVEVVGKSTVRIYASYVGCYTLRDWLTPELNAPTECVVLEPSCAFGEAYKRYGGGVDISHNMYSSFLEDFATIAAMPQKEGVEVEEIGDEDEHAKRHTLLVNSAYLRLFGMDLGAKFSSNWVLKKAYLGAATYIYDCDKVAHTTDTLLKKNLPMPLNLTQFIGVTQEELDVREYHDFVRSLFFSYTTRGWHAAAEAVRKAVFSTQQLLIDTSLHDCAARNKRLYVSSEFEKISREDIFPPPVWDKKNGTLVGVLERLRAGYMLGWRQVKMRPLSGDGDGFTVRLKFKPAKPFAPPPSPSFSRVVSETTREYLKFSFIQDQERQDHNEEDNNNSKNSKSDKSTNEKHKNLPAVVVQVETVDLSPAKLAKLTVPDLQNVRSVLQMCVSEHNRAKVSRAALQSVIFDEKPVYWDLPKEESFE